MALLVVLLVFSSSFFALNAQRNEFLSPAFTAAGTVTRDVDNSGNHTVQAFYSGTVTTCTYRVLGSSRNLRSLLALGYSSPESIPDSLFVDLIDQSAGGPTLSCLPADDDRMHHIKKLIQTIRVKLVTFDGTSSPEVRFHYVSREN